MCISVNQIQVNDYDDFMDKLSHITNNFTFPFSGDILREYEETTKDYIEINLCVIIDGKETKYQFISPKYVVMLDIMDSLIDNKFIKDVAGDKTHCQFLPKKIIEYIKLKNAAINKMELDNKKRDDRWEKEHRQRWQLFILGLIASIVLSGLNFIYSYYSLNSKVNEMEKRVIRIEAINIQNLKATTQKTQ